MRFTIAANQLAWLAAEPDPFATIDGRRYSIMQWTGRSKQFIEKWKGARGYVFLECDTYIFLLAGDELARRMTDGIQLKKSEYALSQWNREDFIRSVQWTGGA